MVWKRLLSSLAIVPIVVGAAPSVVEERWLGAKPTPKVVIISMVSQFGNKNTKYPISMLRWI